MKIKKSIKLNKKSIFIFICFITIISSISLFIIPNMTDGHDLEFHLSRILAIKKALKLIYLKIIYIQII